MKKQADEARHSRRLIGGVLAILLATSAIAAVAVWASSTERGGDGDTDDKSLGNRGKRYCEECAVVASTREIEQPGRAVVIGMAGATMRSEQRGTTERPIRSYEVTVRMRDGSERVFIEASATRWRAGERLILIEVASRGKR
jgi:hypothetical protein